MVHHNMAQLPVCMSNFETIEKIFVTPCRYEHKIISHRENIQKTSIHAIQSEFLSCIFQQRIKQRKNAETKTSTVE